MKAWALRRQTLPLILYVVLADSAAVLLTAVMASRTTLSRHDAVVFAALALAGVLQAAIGRRIEGLRRRVTDTSYVNLTSVWTFAAVLVLPAPLVACLISVLYLQIWFRAPNGARAPLWRAVMNAALVVITCDAARGTLTALGFDDPRQLVAHPILGVLGLLCAMLAYSIVNILLIVPSVWLRTGSIAHILGTADDNLLEISTLCLGAAVATGAADAPALVFALVPPVVMLHRGLLGRGMEQAAIYDSKTGLLSAASWQWAADQSLSRNTTGLTTVFMIDLDRFKSVNDQYGHLVGDKVLHAVAECLKTQVRHHDIVGRFGGEEFVALLPNTDETEADLIAERIRHAVTQLEVTVDQSSHTARISGLSVSVGVADHPNHGTTIADVLTCADHALYVAKASGRNQVIRATG